MKQQVDLSELGRDRHGTARTITWCAMSDAPHLGPRDLEAEPIRRLRLRANGRRPLAVNLRETITKLFELRQAR